MANSPGGAGSTVSGAVHIPHPDAWACRLTAFASAPIGHRCVVADWDRTLTRGADDEGRDHSTFTVLINSGCLGERFARESWKLYERFRPIELHGGRTPEDKAARMREWWSAEFDLLVESGFSKGHVDAFARDDGLMLRSGVPEFMRRLSELDVPVFIVSAGLHAVIEAVLRSRGLLSPNVRILANDFDFDARGVAVSSRTPVIHSVNKSACLRQWLAERSWQLRRNVLVLGDSVEDLEVADGFDVQTLRIAWLHTGREGARRRERLRAFSGAADAVVLDDAGVHEVEPLVPAFWKHHSERPSPAPEASE